MGWPHAIFGFVQNKAQALLDVNFYKVCEDQKGEIMFERLITAFIVLVAVAIVASGLPLSSISGAAPGHSASSITWSYSNAAVLVFLVAYYDLLDGCHIPLEVACLPSIFGRGRECVGYRDDGAWELVSR
jgi:hypothetical protein